VHAPTLQVFRSRVARRVFTLFVIAAVLPVGAMGLLAVQQIGATVSSIADEQLSAVSRGFGQMIYRRLVVADLALARVPVDLADFTPSRDRPTEFDGISVLDADIWLPVYGGVRGLDLSGVDPRLRGRSALLITESAGSASIYIAHAMVGNRVLLGRVDPAYLWDEYTLPYGHEACVLSTGLSTPLYCTAPLPEAPFEEYRQAGSVPSGSLRWEDGGDSFRAVGWELFIPSGFEGVPWRIVAFIDEALALASLNSFERLFPVTLLTITLTVLLLSIWQIRRSMVPLDGLVEGTRRIASQEFNQPVTVQGMDEFGELAHALNSMASRLGRQFTTLKTLAEIDRLILSTGDVEQVFQSALAEMQAVLPCGAAAVLTIDEESANIGHLYFMAHGGGPDVTEVKRVPTTETDRALLARSGRTHAIKASDVPVLEAFAAADLEHVQVFPVSTNREFSGALLLGFAQFSALRASDAQIGRDFADRLAVAMSVSEREARLFTQAHFDTLTGLPNRQLCRDRLHQALAQARRNEQDLALLFLDLDGFKTINDSLGHSAGDLLLRDVASRLLACVRDTDTVSRLGGDEFVVVLPQVLGVTEVEAVAKKVMSALRRPISINGKDVFVTVSIGVAKYPEDGDTVESLLRKADAAMYDAKSAGRSRYVFFTNEIEERATERLSLESDLRVALERGELSLRYQPQLSLGVDDIECAETLLRWTHPKRGPVSPSLFVPLLEEMELIDTVGDWVLETSMKRLRRWQVDGLPLRKIAVNVSARQLRQPRFAFRVSELLRQYAVPANALELEITESAFLEDMEKSNVSLRRLRDMGVSIAIDDFGTGYSSFGYLRDLQFDIVKIDRAFVQDLPDPSAEAITKAIVAVAHTLGKSVVAEGVENDVQLARLRSLGVNAVQGYLISRPLKASDLSHWLGKWVSGEELSQTFIARAMG
jgi:diguanylate cyclase (GGDEF)-like protein